jgi:hypothetical protein
MFTIGIVGHRFLKNEDAHSFIEHQCIDILKRLQYRHPKIIALSAIAEGADSIFAKAALSLNIPLKIVRPFHNYENDFITPAAQDCYRSLRSSAAQEVILPYYYRSESAYLAGMQWVVNQSTLLLAAWNGIFEGGKGGTADAVKKAIHDDCNWIHIDVSSLSVKFFFANANSLL